MVKLNLNDSHDSAVPSNCSGDFPNLVRSTLVVGLKCERVLVNFHNTKAASCALDLAFSVEFTTLYLRSLLHSTKR